MQELGTPRHWALKGEGNANLVFAYAGPLPHLRGKVLRVRKPQAAQAPEQLALEDAVWAPVLGATLGAPASSSQGAEPAAAAAAAAQREQRYVQHVLAPLLGQQHIPPYQPVQPSAAFLQQLLAGSGAAAADAAAAAGTAVLMPDVTLLPGGPGVRLNQQLQGQQRHSERQQQQQVQPPQQQAQQQQADATAASAPVVCVELKPKCGFIAACATVHPANHHLKRSRSRYQLHQMLKLQQAGGGGSGAGPGGKIGACSAYDPCDLFSGEAPRLRAALSALLAQPQNNLALFLDGQRLPSPLQHTGNQSAQQQQSEQQQQPEQQSEQALQGVLSALGQQRGGLVELLAQILEREGVLPRLLRAQQQCQYDIEGVHALYCRLTGQEAAAGAADGPGRSGSSCDAGCSSSGRGSEHGGGGLQASSSHVEALQRLLALPDAEAHAVLRAYVVAATAKDCALMIAMQRLEGPPAAAAAAAAADSGRAAELQQNGRQQLECGPAPALVYCPAVGEGSGGANGGGDSSGGGAWYRYRLCFVDLDLKRLAKIPAHATLDRRILAAARAHLGAAGSSGDGDACGVQACGDSAVDLEGGGVST